MPGWVDTPNEEAAWKKAKKAVSEERGKTEDEFTDRDWGLVTHIAQQILKSSKGEFLMYRPRTIQESRVMAKTALQQEYLAFFQKKLDQYGADSPADLDDAQKKKFFNEIELEWEEGKGPAGESMGDEVPDPTDALDEATDALDDLAAEEPVEELPAEEAMDDGTCPECGAPEGECMCGQPHEGMGGCGEGMGCEGMDAPCEECADPFMAEEAVDELPMEEDEDPESEADYMARMYAVTEVASSLKSVGTLTHLALEEAAEALTGLQVKAKRLKAASRKG